MWTYDISAIKKMNHFEKEWKECMPSKVRLKFLELQKYGTGTLVILRKKIITKFPDNSLAPVKWLIFPDIYKIP